VTAASIFIAYADIDQQVGRFVARPIQMKVASRRSFGIGKKYERIHDLLVAFVWNVDDTLAPETLLRFAQWPAGFQGAGLRSSAAAGGRSRPRFADIGSPIDYDLKWQTPAGLG
jgi:hypothetical protein